MFKISRTACAALAAMTLFFYACDSDNPVTGEHGQHLEALGTAILQGSDTLVMATSADPNDVSGELVLYENETLENLEVIFLDDYGNWFLPNAEQRDDHQLNLLHNQLALQIVVDPDTWLATIQGLSFGETVIRVEIEHGDHADYVSPEFPVHVEEVAGTHGPPVGMNLLLDGDLLVCAHANRDVTGELLVPLDGETPRVDMWFFDEDSVLFQPGADHFPGFFVGDESLLEVLHDTNVPDDELWHFSLSGLAPGSSTLVLDVMHDDHSHYTSPSIIFVVE